ncbi:MAG: DUF1573 domain-containing protein [Saprospiraceae bacterium]
MKITGFLLASSLFLFIACNSDHSSSEETIDEVTTVDPNTPSSIIRNPASASNNSDTVNVAKMDFNEYEYNFGQVNEGEFVKHTFKFKNTGKVPLIISDAKSTCGCTVPKYPKEAIAPGEDGEIYIVFNTDKKEGMQDKPVFITANTWPGMTKLKITGRVIPSKK